jgi:hypothetical protein
MLWPFKKSGDALSLETKLELLARIGFKLDEPFGVEELLSSWPREEFEKPGFSFVLVGLGMTEEQPPWRNHLPDGVALRY